MSKKISRLSAGGTEPSEITILKEVDLAVHQSPVGLEGLYEGQKGLQTAITDYGTETIPEGVCDASLRKLADRLGMRNGDALLADQFIRYYSNPRLLFSRDGLNSTQNREFFSRALLDAFVQGTSGKKEETLNFLQTLKFEEQTEPCTLKTPHKVFIDELLLGCSVLNPPTNEYQPVNAESFIRSLTKASNSEGADRLFGFAKEVNMLSLQIQYALKREPIDKVKMDVLYSKLICSNLAYQLLLDQASEETIANLNENFEYTREMALAQVTMSTLNNNLIEFTGKLDDTSKFFSIFR